MENRALDDALEAAGRSRVRGAVGDEGAELIVEILLYGCAKLVAVDATRSHHLRRMLIIDQRDQQVLESRIFVAAAARLPQGVVKGLFELARKTWHLDGHSLSGWNGPDMVNNVIRLSAPIKS